MSEKYLIVIAGPTASGKTATAIEVAKHYNTAIVSADSRQFYREMSIGTAVPTAEEQAQAKHYLIHNKSIFDNYNVADYEQDALSYLNQIFKSNKYAVLAGGSGLFIDAVCNGIDAIPDIDPEIRKQIEEKLITEGISSLQEEVKRIDPEYYGIVDKDNPRRLQRAIEVYRQTGRTFTSYRTGNKATRDFKVIKTALLWDRQALCQRIDLRVDKMMEDGLLAEAARLYEINPKPQSLNTVGYVELFDFFAGRCTLDEAVNAIKIHTRQYAKRQMTWFRKNSDYQWIEYGQLDEMTSYIDSLSAR